MNSLRKSLTEFQTKNILREFGIAAPPEAEVESGEEAAKAAMQIGFPVVIKLSHPEIAHKSDIGGVILNVQNQKAAERAAKRLISLASGAKALVQRQAPEGGFDLIAGIKRDETFGHIFMLGVGGVYAEIIADTSLHIGAMNGRDVFKMIERLKAKSILEGARGKPSLDKKAVAAALLALYELSKARPEIAELDINPLRVYESGVLALDAFAVIEEPKAPKNLGYKTLPIQEKIGGLFKPASVAVVGASTTSEKAGNIIIKNLKTLGYKGAVYPVNPAGHKIEGLKSYPSVSACPTGVELVVVAVPYSKVETVMEDAAKAGARSAIVVSGGFSDAGEEGRMREQKLVEYCNAKGITLMGPNSIGTIDARSGFCASIGKLPPMPLSGVSIFGQSGVFSTGFSLEEITFRGRGFSKVASIGNKADADESDFLEYFGEDEETSCIGAYIESIKDGARFMSAARKASAKKPCVILKSGKTELGAKAAASHTGSLAGSDAVYEAAFRQTGLLRVENFVEFFAALRTFDMCPLPAGGKIGVVSLTGVGCVLAADACSINGLELAPLTEETKKALKNAAPKWAYIGNPADIWSTIEQSSPAEAFQKISEIMIADETVDILILISVLLEEGAFEVSKPFAAVKSIMSKKPILAAYYGGRKNLIEEFAQGFESIGIPVFNGVDAAIKSASLLYRRSRLLEELERESPK